MKTRLCRILFIYAICFAVIVSTATGSRGQEIEYRIVFTGGGQQTPLRLLTINVWSGLDYEGTTRFGEYEDKERREARFQALGSRGKRAISSQREASLRRNPSRRLLSGRSSSKGGGGKRLSC